MVNGDVIAQRCDVSLRARQNAKRRNASSVYIASLAGISPPFIQMYGYQLISNPPMPLLISLDIAWISADSMMMSSCHVLRTTCTTLEGGNSRIEMKDKLKRYLLPYNIFQKKLFKFCSYAPLYVITSLM